MHKLPLTNKFYHVLRRSQIRFINIFWVFIEFFYNFPVWVWNNTTFLCLHESWCKRFTMLWKNSNSPQRICKEIWLKIQRYKKEKQENAGMGQKAAMDVPGKSVRHVPEGGSSASAAIVPVEEPSNRRFAGGIQIHRVRCVLYMVFGMAHWT